MVLCTQQNTVTRTSWYWHEPQTCTHVAASMTQHCWEAASAASLSIMRHLHSICAVDACCLPCRGCCSCQICDKLWAAIRHDEAVVFCLCGRTNVDLQSCQSSSGKQHMQMNCLVMQTNIPCKHKLSMTEKVPDHKQAWHLGTFAASRLQLPHANIKLAHC